VALRLSEPVAALTGAARECDGGLLAFPAQSNFSGVRHPLSLVTAARSLGFDVLLDAAALVPTQGLDLQSCTADFVAVSFYKMFGLPTGVGALIARHEAMERLRRPWFAGGTVDYVSVQHQRHQLRAGRDGFEDGTPNFLGIAALEAGFALLEEIDMTRLSSRTAALTRQFLAGMRALSHTDGSALVDVHGPDDDSDRGGTVAFNVRGRDGATVRYSAVEQRAREAGVSLRGGCFCNPGAAEAAFGFDADRTARCFSTLGRDFTIPRFAACLGPGARVGAVRASFGAPTNARDLQRALEVIASFGST
jgi:selenocysteine lyase/cysteine desulfurase